MRHLHPERRADLALTGTKSFGRVARHLRRCEMCRAELAGLRHTADIARAPIEVRPPPPHVWIAVTDALGFVFSPAAVEARSTPRQPHRQRPDAARARRFVAVAAAVVGVLVGTMGTLVVRTFVDRDEVNANHPHPVATADLRPVGDQRARGSVRLVETDVGWQLRVVLTAGAPIEGHYEVWLVHDDGIRLVSLGVLAADDGTFGLPPGAISNGYRTVDVSVEPNDGDPRHSHHTVLRGAV